MSAIDIKSRIAPWLARWSIVDPLQGDGILLTCSVEQRSQWLLEHAADLAQRAAQYHIASYLGVDAVSVSRLKRKPSQS